ncbi:putative flotillin [Operophtera brumata]|uniref:Putative flotillin n=1 Tax=Operophtera brumata TaxID=104452 RepID=A0A0L7KPW6_OPEBR|nr:putative flotillin [Operophtera brumata]
MLRFHVQEDDGGRLGVGLVARDRCAAYLPRGNIFLQAVIVISAVNLAGYLYVMTLNPMCEYVETAQGVPLTVTGVAQCKIMNEDELLTTACEQFLGKTVKEIKMTILQTLEGHLRAILGKYLLKSFKFPLEVTSFQVDGAASHVNVSSL